MNRSFMKPTRSIQLLDSRLFFSVAALGVLFTFGSILGCKPDLPKNDTGPQVKVVPPDPMTVLVIGQPEIGPKLTRYWSAAREGGQITVVDRTLDEWIEGGFSVEENIDLVVYPPLFVGELAERNVIAKLQRSQWQSDGVNKDSYLTHFRRQLAHYQAQPYGLPLGGPHFAMFYHLPSFGGDRATLPETWEAFERKLSNATTIDPSVGPTAKLDMPMKEGWAAWSYLARVAPGVRIRGTYSTLFNRTNMKPLIETTPFVESLEQLKRVTSTRSLELDPAAVFRLASEQKSVAAVCFPSRGFSTKKPDDQRASREQLAITSLPGTDTVFDQRTQTWKERFSSEQTRVDVLGFSGLMVSVTEQTRYPKTAIELMEWMSDKQSATKLVFGYETSGPFRASHLGDIGRWAGDDLSLEVGDEYSEVVEEIHDRSMLMMFPRIQGAHRYLESLDRGVRKFLQNDVEAKSVLAEVAQEWEKITDEIGREKQIQSVEQEAGL